MTFDVEMMFSLRCVTRGYTIEAESLEQARSLVLQCISAEGEFDFAKFEKAGGDAQSWDTCEGTHHAYELVEVEATSD